jgi:phage-related protein (TIGR01555 family)
MSIIRLDGLKNIITSLGTRRSRNAGVQVTPRRYLQLDELDVLQQDPLAWTVAHELPSDAITDIDISGLDEIEEVIALLDELDWSAVLMEACAKARHYGGAAIWMVTDPEEDQATPMTTVGSVRRLVVMDRFELTRASETGGAWVETDPYSPDYLKPIVYRYTPAQGGTAQTLRIHASRLIRLYGDPVPARIESSYDYWAAPVMEAVWRALTQEAMAREGASEALYEVGAKKMSIGNLQEIITNPQGDEQLFNYMTMQQSAFSALRAWIVGPGFDVTPHTTSFSGWAEVYDRLAQALASAARMPVTKLFGQAPGGLSTDDASAMRNWSARVGSYQRHVLTPATNRLIKVILTSTDGPTRGVEPERWMVSWSPYEIPSEAEEAATLKTKAEALAILVGNGAISPDEMRNSVKGMSVELDEEMLVQPQPIVADAESYTPPQGVRDNAARALEVRESKPESQRGMTAVGLARARDLSNGRPVSLETVKRMSSYFERHEVDKQGESWDEQGPGWQAWQGWGGDEGRTWVNSILDGLDD